MRKSSAPSSTPERVARHRARFEKHGEEYVPKSVPVVEKMLEMGITPEEISTVVQDREVDLTHGMLYRMYAASGGYMVDLANGIRAGFFLTDDDDEPICW